MTEMHQTSEPPDGRRWLGGQAMRQTTSCSYHYCIRLTAFRQEKEG